MADWQQIKTYNGDEMVSIEVFQNPDVPAEKRVTLNFHFEAYGLEFRPQPEGGLIARVIIRDRRTDNWLLASDFSDATFGLEVWRHPDPVYFSYRNIEITTRDNATLELAGMSEGGKSLIFLIKPTS